jgi:hypothetical protein
MPPAVERPLTPPGWGPSFGEAWGPRTSPAAGGAWGANSGADGWGAAQGATGWGGTSPTNAGWGDTMGGWDSGGAAAAGGAAMGGGWGVGMAPGGSSGTFIPPPPAATYAAGAGQWGAGQTQEHGSSWNTYDNLYPAGKYFFYVSIDGRSLFKLYVLHWLTCVSRIRQ